MIVGGNLVFTDTYRNRLYSLPKNLTREMEQVEPLWTSRAKPYSSTPIETDEALLCFDGSGVLTVLNKLTGETIDKQRLVGFSDKKSNGIRAKSSFSSPILVGDHVIAVFGMGDTMVLAKEGLFYKTKYTNRLGDEEETFLATPAVTRDELLIRSDKYLYCISKN